MLGDKAAQAVAAARLAADRSGVLEALGEDHLQQRQAQPGVGVGVDRQVLEGPRRLRAARVDDDDPAAAVADRVQLVLDPRRGHHAAVRDQRVGADDQQEVGAGEVGDRDLERRAVEELAGGEAVGDVLGGGGVVVRGAERVGESLAPERMRVGEGAGVAHVPADRLAAVLGADSLQPRSDLLQRRLPADPLELAVGPAPQRMQDPVGVVLDVGHRDPLRAGKPGREGVIVVGPQLGQLPVLDRGDHPAEGLADAAVGDSFLGAGSSGAVRARRRHRSHRTPATGQPASPRSGPGASRLPSRSR